MPTSEGGGLIHGDLTEKIIGAAIDVHRALGPGLLESVYEACLAFELTDRGIPNQRQVPLPVEYREVRVDVGFRIDLLVDNAVIVEIKAIEGLIPIHEAQLFTHLRLSKHRVGLLINFNCIVLTKQIKRRVL
ncbi:MAG: GxxExxY protein [Planctomycetota bacterium]